MLKIHADNLFGLGTRTFFLRRSYQSPLPTPRPISAQRPSTFFLIMIGENHGKGKFKSQNITWAVSYFL